MRLFRFIWLLFCCCAFFLFILYTSTKNSCFSGLYKICFFSIMKAVPLLYYCSDVCFLTCFVLHRKDVSLRHFDSEATCYNRHYGYIQIFHFYIYDGWLHLRYILRHICQCLLCIK